MSTLKGEGARTTNFVEILLEKLKMLFLEMVDLTQLLGLFLLDFMKTMNISMNVLVVS